MNPPAIDIHVHVQPRETMPAEALRVLGAHHTNFAEVRDRIADPASFVRYLDRVGVDKAVLINCVCPDVMGSGPEINEWVANYVRAAPDRLIPCGSVHPRVTPDCAAEVDRLARLGIRMLKVHPPHQWLYPNSYRTDLPQQAQIYERAQSLGIPVMFHTGTSIFPRARNVYANPIFIDDVLVDFPDLKVIVAHGGRPIWMSEAYFLLRRSKNVWLDVSSIPPSKLLEYLPWLEQVADRAMFGSDWPGPGVKDIGANLEEFRKLPLAEETKGRILRENAVRLLDA